MKPVMTVRFILLACLLGSGQALAIGLGDIDLKSRLNQRLEAQIPVLVSADTDAEEVTVRLANTAHFKRAGLIRGADVLALKFKPKRVSADRMVIHVSSVDVIKEPILKFIIEVEHKGSRSLRQYTAFLETPSH